MYTPSLGQFLAAAKEYNLIPVYREVFADLETPISVFMKLCLDDPGAFLLESVEGGERVARYSFCGCRPFLSLEHRDGTTRVVEGFVEPGEPAPPSRVLQGSPLQHLRELMAGFRPAAAPNLPRFYGGAVGFLGYDVVRYVENLPGAPADDRSLPDALFQVHELVAIFDHFKHRLAIVVNTRPGHDPQGAYRHAQALLDRAVERMRLPLPVAPGPPPAPRPRKLAATANVTRETFEAGVRKVKEYIAAGDAFQVVLSQRLQTQVRARPLDIYRVLRTVNPSPYMFYLSFGDRKIIGASPEMMVRVEDGIAEMRPIAGTMPRGRDEDEDRVNENRLLTDEKERAEHVMLVDLGRNDLGRVCEYGSVEVKELMRVERYSHVMHIVSDVQGRLKAGRDVIDAIAATFPAGTLSGAPKVRAMQIIDELETTKRGPYGGAVGYIAFTGNMDTCITIRTMVLQGATAYVQAGAGIVADSDPSREYEECLNKAAALIRALEIAEEGVL